MESGTSSSGGSGVGGEGLQILTSLIDNILSKVRVSVANFEITLVHLCKYGLTPSPNTLDSNDNHMSELHLKLVVPRFEFTDISNERQPSADNRGDQGNDFEESSSADAAATSANAIAVKHVSFSGIRIELCQVNPPSEKEEAYLTSTTSSSSSAPQPSLPPAQALLFSTIIAAAPPHVNQDIFIRINSSNTSEETQKDPFNSMYHSIYTPDDPIRRAKYEITGEIYDFCVYTSSKLLVVVQDILNVVTADRSEGHDGEIGGVTQQHPSSPSPTPQSGQAQPHTFNIPGSFSTSSTSSGIIFFVMCDYA